MRPQYALLLGTMLLVGCGGSEQSSVEDPSTADPADRDTVFDPLVETVDRAKGVQQTVDEQAAELRRRVEEAEGN